MPNTQSQEKISLLKALGAEVVAVPAVPYEVRIWTTALLF